MKKRHYNHHNNCGCHHGQKCHKCHPEHPPVQGAMVQRVVCTKEVQKTAEILLPAAIGPLGPGGIGGLTPGALLGAVGTLLGVVGDIINLRVTPDFTAIQQEATVIKDKVINLGYIPATLDVFVTGGNIEVSVPIQVFFQEHTDCPGARPGDTVTETDPVVEADFYQDLLATDAAGNTVVNLLLFKAILCTRVTVTRPAIEKDGEYCDVDACSTQNGPTRIKSPQNLTPNTSPLNG
ncbi:hypothetical protein JNUCC1_01785 [Lentibacillus sp. JNUCC-1]|uniref:hypothetical protein n=1 Tax=Lentibacillus sp. JNUCC-1 TaxID=2654513 RepID=UPI0012E89774|nr:hypothetical protein [Lentibacillus sp. JNUCC-1]MUV37977.1 hypothetical protein [Lentibacillus sp. JNUCC-1]